MHSVRSFTLLSLLPSVLLASTVLERGAHDTTVLVTKTNTKYVCPCDSTSSWSAWSDATYSPVTTSYNGHLGNAPDSKSCPHNSLMNSDELSQASSACSNYYGGSYPWNAATATVTVTGTPTTTTVTSTSVTTSTTISTETSITTSTTTATTGQGLTITVTISKRGEPLTTEVEGYCSCMLATPTQATTVTVTPTVTSTLSTVSTTVFTSDTTTTSTTTTTTTTTTQPVAICAPN